MDGPNDFIISYFWCRAATGIVGSMNVRRLRPGDEELAADAVNTLKPLEERGGNNADVELMKGFLVQESNYLVIAYEESTPLGFALGYRLPRFDRPKNMMYLHEVGVAEAHHGKGIGKAIMQEMIRICRDEGYMEMFVITDTDNKPAMGLYRTTGGTHGEENDIVFCWDFEV